MDPGRPSPLKHARRFAWIALIGRRRFYDVLRRFSCRTFASRTIVASLSEADRAAPLAAQMTL